ncbi:IS66 family transposase, partial [Cellulosilyticum ruminicola]|uniref:IS66 family transposase n=1 Tax=Cellulosilyticum ruminicola TaxID=425254 RepID=UPI0012EE1D56
YLSLVWDRLHQELYRSPIIQADETPVLVNKDGGSAGVKSYMWVYRTGKMYDAAPIVFVCVPKNTKSESP